MLKRPESCRACPLDAHATGFSAPSGPPSADVVFWGEALGKDEAAVGSPFIGASGRHLDRLLKRLGHPRDLVRVANTISCRPPEDRLAGAPYEQGAIAACAEHRAPVLAEGHKVHVALGGTAAKVLLNYPPKFSVRSFHGCPFWTEHGWVVPTFHPSSLFSRGGSDAAGGPHFSSTWLFDVQRAFEIAEHGWHPTSYDAIVDPPADWFSAWCDAIPDGTWLIGDIETPGKIARDQKAETREDDVEADPEGDDNTILRIGFSVHPDEGVSVPWEEPYLAIVKRLLARPMFHWYWYRRFDAPKLIAAGMRFGGPVMEGMDIWGALQGRLPQRIAFVAPFFSTLGPWKHLSGSDLGLYNALDCIQECRVIYGCAEALRRENRLEPWWRHRHLVDVRMLQPAEEVGLRANREALVAFGAKLDVAMAEMEASFSTLTDIGKVTMKRRVKDAAGYTQESVMIETLMCGTCGAADISKKHRCKKLKGEAQRVPDVKLGTASVARWVKRDPFNPDSRLDVLAYLKRIDEQPGRSKKTLGPSVGKSIVEGIVTRTADPLLKAALRFKAISKVKGTYVDGMLKRLGSDSRLHPEWTHKPWTGRLSCQSPNLQNVSGADEDEDRPESGFKHVVEASPGCLLLEPDFQAIEAVLSGYFMGDPTYMRLALLGIHAYVTSHYIGKPADLRWSDADLSSYFAELKHSHPKDYKACKQGVHARNYVGSAFAVQRAQPRIFPTVKDAQGVIDLYDTLTPKRVAWWKSLWDLARRQNYLENPFRYRAYFWEIDAWNAKWRRWDFGKGTDANKSVAFKPQSTAYGIQAEAGLELWDPDSPAYVGDMYFGKTPLRAPIHDSFLCEVEERFVDAFCARVRDVMTRPVMALPCPPEWGLGTHLRIGVSIKAGRNWGSMEEIKA